MKIRVVTTWNKQLYRQYAHRFENTYCWDFPLTVYNEDDGMFDLIPECKEFVERNKHRPHADFLRDATRFCYKVYAYTHAILNDNDSDYIIGIDADSVFYQPMTEKFVADKLHKPDHMMTYLGRGGQYSECGFLGFNMQHPYTKMYAATMKKMYDSDELFKLIEWHDSYIWDHVRMKFEGKYQIKNLNIGDRKKAHVQARSILARYYDHTKGEVRKRQGFSAENKEIEVKK